MPPTVADITAAFVEAVPRASRPADSQTLRSCVEAAWLRARAAHPACRVSPIALFAYLGHRMSGGDPAVELERRYIADLYLACGCDGEDPAALAALERDVLPRVQRTLASKFAPDDQRELMQVLREQMLVAKDGRRGIAAYDGRAPLVTWLRVCVTRLALRRVGRERRAVHVADANAALEQLAPGVPDPELAYLKRRYGAEFRAAFGEAVASLAPRARNLLRHSVVDGLGIDQIAAIYHVHRATAARQLKQARVALIEATRHRMRLALGVGETELESILRVLISMTDITLREILVQARGHARDSDDAAR